MANTSSLKSISIHTDGWPLGNNGIEVSVDDDEGHVGDLIVKKAGIVWCPGKTPPKNGIDVKWHDLQLLLGSRAALKAALNAVQTMD